MCVSPVATVTLVELSTRLLHWLNWWLNMLNPMEQFMTPSTPPVGRDRALTTLISEVSPSLNPLNLNMFDMYCLLVQSVAGQVAVTYSVVVHVSMIS